MARANPLAAGAAYGAGDLETMITELDKLVSLPDVYYRLEDAIVDPGSNSDSIAGLLHHDPDLCARLLRMANSAFYSFPTRIETIERAVNTLGLRQIRELVLITSVVKVFNGINPGTVNMNTFWEHSVAVAIMARELGRQAGLAKADGFYVCGLLHDIGRLVMYLKLPDTMHDILARHQATGTAMHRLEFDMLGYSHAEIGGRLMELWKLPQSIWEPVATHHEPQKSGEYLLHACAVHIADAWINAHCTGSSDGEFEIDSEADARIGLDADRLDHIGTAAREGMQAVMTQFLGH